MNTSLPEMLHCLNAPENLNRNTKMSLLEKQQVRFKWQQEQLLQQPPQPAQLQQPSLSYFSSNAQLNAFSATLQAQHLQGSIDSDQNLGELLSEAMKPDPGLENGCNSFASIEGGNSGGYGVCGYGNVTGFKMNYGVERTASCPPAVSAAIAEVATAAIKGKEIVLPEKLSSGVGRESFKKRKADKTHNTKVATEETKDKKLKGCTEEKDSKATEQKSASNNTATNNKNNREPSDTSKENSKISEVQKPDYIHVRARRGQATDSHSLAERLRREKISERMKYLQDLVPGCDKITGKAGMLDEIINYVQSLQRQVEFLSMKLAAVNTRLDYNIDNVFTKGIFPAGTSEFYPIAASSELNIPPSYQSDAIQPMGSCCGLEIGVDSPDVTLRRTISAPVSIPETLFESPCFSHLQACSTWDAELQSLYGLEFQQARSSLLSQQ